MIRQSLAAAALLSAPAFADPPQVVDAAMRAEGGTWTVSVTLTHPDTGWDHFASGWEVLAPDGTRLGYRELAHPHVNEQPFTRSLSGVPVPSELDHLLVRSRCNLDGWVATAYRLDLPK